MLASNNAAMQTDMREMNEGEVSLETTAEVLELLLSFMYGCLEYIATKFLLPLFQISDCHQVRFSR